MLTVEEARARILEGAARLSSEQVSLSDAHGRVLAQDVVSPRNVPPWDNSAMDGYAVRAEDTVDAPVSLRLLEVIGAGCVPQHEVVEGTASAVMTGAPMPAGADAVVMIEHSDGARQGRVELTRPAKAGQHIRRKGEDVAEGSMLLEAGTRLLPGHVGLLASVGIASVGVVRRPRVAILSTGDEVVAPGQPLAPGQIYSSNNHALAGLVLQDGGIPWDLGIAADDPPELKQALQRASSADAVLTTGGVSVGMFDHVRDVLDELTGGVDFWKVAMKPGKPLAFGRLGGDEGAVPLFGLPGNPVSAMVVYLQVVRPWLRGVQGLGGDGLPRIQARLAEPFRQRPGRVNFVRVVLSRTDEGWSCRGSGLQSSGVLTSMARAHGLMVVPADVEELPEGSRVQVQVLDPEAL